MASRIVPVTNEQIFVLNEPADSPNRKMPQSLIFFKKCVEVFFNAISNE
jgi:hypothetical protein